MKMMTLAMMAAVGLLLSPASSQARGGDEHKKKDEGRKCGSTPEQLKKELKGKCTDEDIKEHFKKHHPDGVCHCRCDHKEDKKPEGRKDDEGRKPEGKKPEGRKDDEGRKCDHDKDKHKDGKRPEGCKCDCCRKHREGEGRKDGEKRPEGKKPEGDAKRPEGDKKKDG